MKSDMEIRRDVEAELRWEPRVNDATAIGVAVKNGVATISGHVQSYLERSAAERAVERVSGVTAVANELDVHLPSDWERTDEEIAQAAVNAVKWNLAVPVGRIQIRGRQRVGDPKGRRRLAVPAGCRQQCDSIPHGSQGRHQCGGAEISNQPDGCQERHRRSSQAERRS